MMSMDQWLAPTLRQANGNEETTRDRWTNTKEYTKRLSSADVDTYRVPYGQP